MVVTVVIDFCEVADIDLTRRLSINGSFFVSDIVHDHLARRGQEQFAGHVAGQAARAVRASERQVNDAVFVLAGEGGEGDQQ